MAITETQVHEAARQLDARGQKPTIRAIREHLGEGSLTTIMRHMQTYNPETVEGAIEAPDYPEELASTWAAVWRDCYAAARKLFEEERAELESQAKASAEALEQIGALADEYSQEVQALRAECAGLRAEVERTAQQLRDADATNTELQARVFVLDGEVERQHELLQSCIGRALPQGETLAATEAAALAANRTLDLPPSQSSRGKRRSRPQADDPR